MHQIYINILYAGYKYDRYIQTNICTSAPRYTSVHAYICMCSRYARVTYV